MGATKATIFDAKVESGVTAVREWQRGSINWTECVRRLDVTGNGERKLSNITNTSPEDQVRIFVTAAVAAGND